MEKNPTKRFTTEQALRHPWLVLSLSHAHTDTQAQLRLFLLSGVRTHLLNLLLASCP